MDNKDILEVTLNFSDCDYLGEVHKIIKEQLNFPEWYGCNLDALWDCLTGIMQAPANIKIVFKPEKKSTLALSDEIQRIIEVFKEATDEYGEIQLFVDI
ncbi:MAG: barstar family protein [Ruminococcus sp.]|nr:barstar family protein [Ruminococcus sp.]